VKVHLNIEHYVCVELVVGSIVLALAPRSGVGSDHSQNYSQFYSLFIILMMVKLCSFWTARCASSGDVSFSCDISLVARLSLVSINSENVVTVM
jgi:hypothetical protein